MTNPADSDMINGTSNSRKLLTLIGKVAKMISLLNNMHMTTLRVSIFYT